MVCKGASGFGWNNQECMVTATEEVWNTFLVSHPAAKRFKNTAFPEYHELTVIFVGNAATGTLRRSSATAVINAHEELERPNMSASTGEDNKVATRGSQQSGVRPSCQHWITCGNQYKNSIDFLISAFESSQDHVPKDWAAKTMKLAMNKFQDGYASQLSMDDLVAGFSVLENNSRAQGFLAIQEKSHCCAWLRSQIAERLALRRED